MPASVSPSSCIFVYANLLSAAKVWIEKGDLPPAIGVWWVHMLALAFGLYLVYREATRHVNTLDRYLYRTVILYTRDGDGACC